MAALLSLGPWMGRRGESSGGREGKVEAQGEQL